MPKHLSLFFAIITVVFMSLTAISISHNGWLVLLFATLAFFSTGAGFIVKARLRRKAEQQQ